MAAEAGCLSRITTRGSLVHDVRAGCDVTVDLLTEMAAGPGVTGLMACGDRETFTWSRSC